MVVEPDDVAGVCLFDVFPVGGEEGEGAGEFDFFSDAHVVELHAFAIDAGADAQKGDAVPVSGVHVGLDFEDETGEFVFAGGDGSGGGGIVFGGGGIGDECVHEMADAEVVEGGSEEDGGLLPGQVGVFAEGMAGAAHEFDLFAQGIGHAAQRLIQFRVVKARQDGAFPGLGLLVGPIEGDGVLIEVVDALELVAHANGPGDGGALDVEDIFHFVEEVDGRPTIAVEFVDEGDDGGVAQLADPHEFFGALFDASGDVDDHQCRVDRGEGAVGVFGEVGMSGGVEQVDDAFPIGKLHDG